MTTHRYRRQEQFYPIGKEGQKQLLKSKVLLCGCGALGSVISESLTRAGVGSIHIIDRDEVQLDNLQRQSLYREADVLQRLPKAVAAKKHLQAINSEITITASVADLTAENILSYLDGVDLILDGTDNFETRYLLNEAAIHKQVPWIFGGCLEGRGQVMPILPGRRPCLNCVLPYSSAPPGGETCDSAGVLGPIVQVIAAFEVCEALKILTGNIQAVNRSLVVVDLWKNETRQIDLTSLRNQGGCSVCRDKKYQYFQTSSNGSLRGKGGQQAKAMCGNNSVQLRPSERVTLDLTELARRLQKVGSVSLNPYLLKFYVDDYEMTLFADGRTIVYGTTEIGHARSLYAQYIGC
ncbi:MAG: ThiF family adenylyltransferase [Pirellulaceae bacterium]|nr:ThiF family adenylyltransferase [Pirellulaceae bacterium]